MNLRSRAHDEGGLALVVVAVMVTAMMAMVALVLDGGHAYATRRHMQNAADAAAVAAARSLDRARFSGGLLASVDGTARSVLEANGGASSGPLYDCTVIDKNGAAIAPCSDIGVLTGWAAPANILRSVGVRVNTGTTRAAAFGGIAGTHSLTAKTTAAASIQPVLEVDSPFMVCGNALKGAHMPGGLPLLVPDSTLDPPWKINPQVLSSPVPLAYNLHGPSVSNCGAQGNPFKGLADGPFTAPGWLATTTGVRAGPTRSAVADRDGCSGTVLHDCILIVPSCVDGQGSGSAIQLNCVTLGAFRVTEVSSNQHTGVLQPGAVTIGGQTGTGDPTGLSVRTVKLVS